MNTKQYIQIIPSPYNPEWNMIRLFSPDMKSGVCEIQLHGAHLTSYKRTCCASPISSSSSSTLSSEQSENHHDDELMFVSEKAVFATDKAIRGGTPICFPQFSDKGRLSMSHGFARNVKWEHVENVDSSNMYGYDSSATVACLRMIKSSSYEGTNKEIAQYLAEYDVLNVEMIFALSNDSLEMTLRVAEDTNALVEDEKFAKVKSFTFAFHNYFRVDDITHVTLDGIHNNHHGVQYIDKVKKGELITVENSSPFEITQEVDRVYLDMLNPIESVIVENKPTNISRMISISQNASTAQNVVVWNIWKEKCQKMSDMKTDDFSKYVCVEVGQIQTPVELERGKVFTSSQKIAVKHVSQNSSKL
ncbi:hypothetical protein FDP41_001225 [Naegleria fowleri]|uniref:glucose-6-phosphate 1-epimerase n=1 Tax=Naegleria fowleri TaxID=5763 RepID=A0A6A5BZX2_NAEFO|nr:uncharacterized protein FDP41_001225 [Naegleria fowleri]KAF0980072.1 hypothetical protein FDP41_001225 [Naegleria fowleri]CAG4716091.1 unnamed protein product [Naegleria fowleri]